MGFFCSSYFPCLGIAILIPSCNLVCCYWKFNKYSAESCKLYNVVWNVSGKSHVHDVFNMNASGYTCVYMCINDIELVKNTSI